MLNLLDRIRTEMLARLIDLDPSALKEFACQRDPIQWVLKRYGRTLAEEAGFDRRALGRYLRERNDDWRDLPSEKCDRLLRALGLWVIGGHTVQQAAGQQQAKLEDFEDILAGGQCIRRAVFQACALFGWNDGAVAKRVGLPTVTIWRYRRCKSDLTSGRCNRILRSCDLLVLNRNDVVGLGLARFGEDDRLREFVERVWQISEGRGQWRLRKWRLDLRLDVLATVCRERAKGHVF